MLGIISLASRDHAVPPDMGWLLLEPYEGKGYATEAGREVLRYLVHDFQGGFRNAKPDMIEIIAWPKESNRQSVRVAEKLGMVDMGEIGSGGGEASVVFGVEELVGVRDKGKRWTRETTVNFFGPGERGQRAMKILGGEDENQQIQ